MKPFKLIIALLLLPFRLLIWVFEGIFWLLALNYRAADYLTQIMWASMTPDPDHIVCPKGHRIETYGTFQCEACGFIYEGNVFQCRNPECKATTPHIRCPECGLSVSNPYRWNQ